MTQERKLELIRDAYKSKKVEDEREQIKVINDELPKEFHDAIRDVQFELNNETGTFELDYNIMARACDILADNCDTIDALKKADMYELSTDSASVYTSTRLGYITNQNQDEISEKMKEFDCDIQTAAAVWYDAQVASACEKLRDYILADES